MTKKEFYVNAFDLVRMMNNAEKPLYNIDEERDLHKALNEMEVSVKKWQTVCAEIAKKGVVLEIDGILMKVRR